ncbi:kinase-like protein [Lichtheimia hyalospora FSU 10163]|nr:kinase-like protein [Lichtheimia hyalospora FSU 10163]
MQVWLLLLLLVFGDIVSAQGQLGTRQNHVPWRAGHAGAYVDPYVIVYGGNQEIDGDPNSNLSGTNDMWVWHSQQGAWYHPNVAVSSGNTMPGQIFFAATHVPSPGQMLAIASNISGGASSLQKLDTNSWSWSFPTASLSPPGHASGYAMSLVNNSLYYYGGLSVDDNGHPITNAVLNSLYVMDANAYTWAPASNGMQVTDHAMCYIPHCNCIISYGGSTTGSKSNPVSDVFTYALDQGTWNLQVQVQSSSNAVPGARRLHTANCLDDRMIIFGGGTDRAFDTGVWILDASQYPQLQWRQAPMTNLSSGPNARMGHTAVLDEAKQKIYIFGGWGVGATNDSDIYILDIQAWSWTRVAPEGFDAQSTPPPTIAPPDSDNEASGQQNDNSHQTIIGAAVGGTIGGAIVLATLCFLLLRRSKRRQKQEKTLAPEEDDIEQQQEKRPQEKNAIDEKRDSMNGLNSVGTNNNVKHLSVNSSINNSAFNVPSLMTTEHPTTATTTSEEAVSMSHMIIPPQSPNEIILQKPNEFTRPITGARGLGGSINSSTLASAGLGSPTVPYVHFSHPTITSSSTSSTIPLAQRVNMAAINSPTTTTTIDKNDDNDDYDNISPLERLARLQSLPMQMPADRYTVDSTPHHVGPTNKIWFGTLENDPVALKVFGRREAWERECRALVKLQSATQHVVALQEMLTIGNNDNNLEYIAVLERLESASLSRIMIRDIAAGLAACHSHDIAFCDLKPSNVMQKYQQGKYVFKLIDFEASRTIGQECVGLITPRYCPPEVARATTYGIESHGVVASANVDLWSLGCIIYELEANEALFPNNITDDTVLHFISHPSPLTPGLNNGIRWNEQVELDIPGFEHNIHDPQARDIIKTLLSRDPIKRGTIDHWMKHHPYFSIQEED